MLRHFEAAHLGQTKHLSSDIGALLLDAYTIFFGTVTILYQAVLFSKAPAWLLFVAIAAAAILAILATAANRRDPSTMSSSAIAGWPTIALIFAGALAFSLFFGGPDSDA